MWYNNAMEPGASFQVFLFDKKFQICRRADDDSCSAARHPKKNADHLNYFGRRVDTWHENGCYRG